MTQPPAAYLHTLHMEGGQNTQRLSLSADNPFGVPGRDYDKSYSATCQPLFGAPPAAASRERLPAQPCDRDEAKRLLDILHIHEHQTGTFRNWDATVQAFARHRLAAQQARDCCRATLEQAAKVANEQAKRIRRAWAASHHSGQPLDCTTTTGALEYGRAQGCEIAATAIRAAAPPAPECAVDVPQPDEATKAELQRIFNASQQYDPKAVVGGGAPGHKNQGVPRGR